MFFKSSTLLAIFAFAFSGCQNTTPTPLYYNSGDIGGFESYRVGKNKFVIYAPKSPHAKNRGDKQTTKIRADISLRAAAENCSKLSNEVTKVTPIKHVVYGDEVNTYEGTLVPASDLKISRYFECRKNDENGALIEDVLNNTEYLNGLTKTSKWGLGNQ